MKDFLKDRNVRLQFSKAYKKIILYSEIYLKGFTKVKDYS